MDIFSMMNAGESVSISPEHVDFNEIRLQVEKLLKQNGIDIGYNSLAKEIVTFVLDETYAMSESAKLNRPISLPMPHTEVHMMDTSGNCLLCRKRHDIRDIEAFRNGEDESEVEDEEFPEGDESPYDPIVFVSGSEEKD